MAVPFHLVVRKEFRNPIDVGSMAMMGFRVMNRLFYIIPYYKMGYFLQWRAGATRDEG